MSNLNTIEPPAASAEALCAGRTAAHNFSANLSALADTQPRLVEAVEAVPRELEFVFGRDACLTAIDGEGRWWSGCSLPKRANGAMLRSLKVNGPVSCLLAPPHAASLRVAQEMTLAVHAIVTIIPDLTALSVLLACDDFSADILRHRVWFAWGPGWSEELEKLFDERQGLPTPSQFIRLPVAEQETIDGMIKSAQAAFAAVLARRSILGREMREAWRPAATNRPPALCVLTTRQFAMWNEGSAVLGAMGKRTRLPVEQSQGVEPTGKRVRLPMAPESFPSSLQEAPELPHIVAVYLDEPLHGSPLALLSAAVRCDAVVTADVARADMAELLPRELPWVTWMTTPRVPAFAAAGPNDVLLTADPHWKRRAEDAGWPAERVSVARWPDLPAVWATDSPGSDDAARPLHRRAGTPTLAIIADTRPLDPPASLDDFSSQRLLWNSIRHELEAEPLILTGVDPGTFLEERLQRFSVSGDGLDRSMFVEQLIVPCYGQGIARLLLGAGLPLRLYGVNWSDIPEFALHAAGPIVTRTALANAVVESAALVHVWPAESAHPIEAAGLPVVRPLNRRIDTLLHEAMSALRSKGRGETAPSRMSRSEDRLSPARVLHVLAASIIR